MIYRHLCHNGILISNCDKNIDEVVFYDELFLHVRFKSGFIDLLFLKYFFLTVKALSIHAFLFRRYLIPQHISTPFKIIHDLGVAEFR